MKTWSPLSKSSIKFLARQGIRVTLADAEVEKPRKVAADVAGSPSKLPEHELRVWEVSLAHLTADNPCKMMAHSRCKRLISDRLAYVVLRQFYGPEFPHSRPCCNPPPFSKEPRTSTSWSMYDANTGKFLGGGRLG